MDLTQVFVALGIPGIAIICWALTAVVDSWQKARRIECETTLKEQMIARGMSAEDIAGVLRAGRLEAAERNAKRQQEAAPKEIGQLLAEYGFEADDIVK